MLILQEIHTLKTQLEAAKYDIIKYCIGKSWFGGFLNLKPAYVLTIMQNQTSLLRRQFNLSFLVVLQSF
jgi:hypothetical protein